MLNSTSTSGALGLRASWLRFKTESHFKKICVMHVCKSFIKGQFPLKPVMLKKRGKKKGTANNLPGKSMFECSGRHFIVKSCLGNKNKLKNVHIYQSAVSLQQFITA